MKKALIPILALILALGLALPMATPALAAPSGLVDVESDNILELGDSKEVVVTFKNTADTAITDVASTIQFITLSAANLNPTRTSISLFASWEIWESEIASNYRASGSVVTSGPSSEIYAPYSTTNPVDLYTWALGKPDGNSGLSVYTSSDQFEGDLKILRPGELSKLKITVNCMNIVGDARLWFFFKATEYEPSTVPVSDISVIPENQRMNLYYSKAPGSDKTLYWWPLHNSYDPYDSDLGTGHNFGQLSWNRQATTHAFAKSNKLVHQKPVENPELACIDITKEGPATAQRGETITYEFTVTNCGTVALNNVTVTDPLFAPSLIENIGELAVGASYTFTETYTIPNDAPLGLLTNEATASGEHQTTTVTEQDGHSVLIIAQGDPCIDITKEGPATAQRGETITYEFTVTNCGTVALTGVKVTDPLFGDTWGHNIGELPVGASSSFTETYTILTTDPSPLTNTSTASGQHDTTPVTAQDSHSVIVERTFSFHICGTKFLDLSKDGKYDAAIEPGMNGVTVFLLGPDKATKAEEWPAYQGKFTYPPNEGNPLWTGENDLKGSYCFNLVDVDAVPGTYEFYIKEVIPSGYVPTTETLIGSITLVASEDGPRESINNDFGNARPQVQFGGGAAVGGEVYPINKTNVLAPWLSLALIIAISASILVMRRRTTRQG